MSLLYPLCSSSKGNAVFLGERDAGILIDAGISVRQFKHSLALAGIEPPAVRAIFITHEHSDHIRGLSSLVSLLQVPVYASKETLEALIRKDIFPYQSTICEIRRSTAQVAGMEIRAFPISHDAAGPQCYTVTSESGRKACVCTDLGRMTPEILACLSGSSALLLESNYDPEMLRKGSYPGYLKRRIASQEGHLSNPECAQALAGLFGEGTTRFILGHLSEQNNRPELAFAAALARLDQAGALLNEDYILQVAKPRTMGEFLEF